MEAFLKIDWKPSVNDVLDDVFINEERLTQESVMYKLLHGNFINPFDNMDEDYKAVNMDIIKEDQNTRKGKEKNTAANNNSKQESTEKVTIEKKSYVPCLTKMPYQFPRMSDLSKEEHAICLRALLKFSGSEKPELTDADKEDAQTYLRLKDTINEEQDQYLEFIKEKWDGSSLKIYCENYINLRWKYKLQNILKLPRYYMETTNIPFVSDKKVTVQYVATCLEKGYVPMVTLPTFCRPHKLHIQSSELEERFPIPIEYSDTSMHFKLPVSKDPACEFLAKNNEVDLVISSSGLNCLASNAGPNYSRTWMLPVTIKSHNGKNVIYIDKQAPPYCATVPEKNTWVYKYILKHSMIQWNPAALKRQNNVKKYDENLFGNIHSEDYVMLEDGSVKDLPAQSNSSELNSTNSKPEFTNENVDTLMEQDNANTTEQKMRDSEKQPDEEDYTKKDQTKIDNKSNVSYNLFKIGPTGQNELMKNTIKEYKILTRLKDHGFEKLGKIKKQKLLLAPKLEHQTALGAEAVTSEEGLKQWISLIFRPGTCLARVRISAMSSEIIQVEKRTPVSIDNEIRRLYNIKTEDTLVLLHNVIQTLSNLTPGEYMIRHTARNGAFATIYKATDNTRKNNLDLHTIFGDNSQFHTIPNPPWPMLDKVVVTPMLKCFQRLPLMFYPPRVSKKQKFIKNKRKINKKK